MRTRAASMWFRLHIRTITLFDIFVFWIVFHNTISMNRLASTESKQNPFENARYQQDTMKLMGPDRPPTQKPLDAVWQPVADTKNAFYVYSAFLDRRLDPPAVRVIAATTTKDADPVFCRLWLKSLRAYIVRAWVDIIGEHHDRYHSAAFVTCLLKVLDPEDVVGAEIAVVAKSEPERLATNLLSVMDTIPKIRSNQTVLHLCVRPLHGSYNDVERMVEWIELNRMLGATHFYFYDISIGDRLDCMFNNYQNNEELFTVLPFKLPISDLWMEGQLASSHDCLYRSIPKADWLLLIDVDELVLPHNRGVLMLQQQEGRQNMKTLPAMFDMLSAESHEAKYSLVFRNAFFYLGWEDDPKSPVPLLTSKKTRRTQLINWYGVRSKYAVRPSKALRLGIHEVVKFEAGNDKYNKFVRSRVALLHHYREDPADIFPVEDYLSTIDRAAHRWAKRLWTRVQERLREISLVCS